MTGIFLSKNENSKHCVEKLLNLQGKLSGFKKVRIGVDKENPQSNSFWKKNGFYIIAE